MIERISPWCVARSQDAFKTSVMRKSYCHVIVDGAFRVPGVIVVSSIRSSAMMKVAPGDSNGFLRQEHKMPRHGSLARREQRERGHRRRCKFNKRSR